MTPVHTGIALQKRNLQLYEPESLNGLERTIFIILDSKRACTLLWRETVSQSFKIFGYINILEKIVWSKGHSVPHLQDVQKCERPMENCLPTQNYRIESHWFALGRMLIAESGGSICTLTSQA